MAKKVTVVNSSMVPPALPTPSDPIWLSNLDLISASVHIPLVFFFRNNSSPHLSPSPAASIKDSLARILVPYYPFAGSFGNSADGRREIKCTGEGALFFEAASDLTLDEFSAYNNSLKNCLLVPTDVPNSFSEKEDEDKTPILLVQLTAFRCGGLCLGIAINHQATDGIAALRFICNWAATTRDPRHPIPTPSFDHTSLRPRSPPSVQFPHPEFDFREGAEKQMTSSFIFLNLTPVQLSAIKALGGDKYSSFESMAAYIWRCVCLARGSAGPDEERRLLTVADMRRRVGHLFQKEYIGNAIMLTAAVAPSREVVAETLPLARIREAIEKLTEEYLQSAIDLIELPEDERRVSRFSGSFAAMDISVTNWSKLPLYEADFGWGLPELVVPTGHVPPGHFLVLPSLDGGVKIACSLEAEKMEGFVKLFYELFPIVTVKDSDV